MRTRFAWWAAALTLASTLSVTASFAVCPFPTSPNPVNAAGTREALASIRLAREMAAATAGNSIGMASVTPNELANLLRTRPEFDLDCSGAFSINDATLLARYSMGFRGDALTAGLALTGRRNSAALIEGFIAAGCPVPSPVVLTSDPLRPFATDSCANAAPLVSNRWSDAATWGGQVPGAGANVVIPLGKTVMLDVPTAALGSLKIEGRLIAEQSRSVGITANYVLVTGPAALLEIGSATEPFLGSATITLTGNTTVGNPLVPGLGNKVLGVMGGTLRLHGRPAAVNWTQLNGGDIPAGTANLVLEHASGWRVGDQVVVATSGMDMNSFTLSTVQAVNGNQITLATPTAHPHFGAKKTFYGTTVDVRAEVGRLTQNIVVQGDDGSVASRIGGHSMFMSDGFTSVQLANVEYRRMGQLNQLGRYPVHFHLMNDRCTDCYVRDVSVNGSVQRGIVVHGTENVRVSGNVSFNTPGHNFVIEDPAAKNNLIERNLGLVNITPSPALNEFTLVRQSDMTPANFWINGARNVIRFNRAAGAISSGFFFDGVRDGPANFTDNTAHASMNRTNDVFPMGSGLTLLMSRTGMPGDHFSRFTTYHNDNGFWSENAGYASRSTDPPIVNSDFLYYDNRSNIFVRDADSRSISNTPTLIAGPLTRSNELSRNQYGGYQEIYSPTLVNFSVGFGAAVDTHPTISRYIIDDVRRLNSSLPAFPSDRSQTTYLDSSVFPVGTYFPEAAVAATNPTCVLTEMIAPDGTERRRYHRCTDPSETAEIELRQLATPRTRRHTLQDIRRSDGLVFRSMGDRDPQPFMFVGGILGYTAILGTSLTYFVDTPSTSGYALTLHDNRDDSPPGVNTPTSMLETTIRVNGPPSGVFREGTGDDPPTSSSAAARLTAATLRADFMASPLSKYWYDSAAGTLTVNLNRVWLSIRP